MWKETMVYPSPPSFLDKKDLRDPDLKNLDASLFICYTWMYLARAADNRILDLFRQGLIRGTVAGGQGNEGLVVPMTLLADKEIDVVSFSHRGLGGKLIWSKPLGEHFSHYFANAGSPTAGREGNVHYGDPLRRSYPMISHLGAMPSNVLGGADSQRRFGRPAIGITFFGDGASSTGDIHECMNLATLYGLPILFVLENNEYAYSTPTSEQFATENLVRRAEGYGMKGTLLDISDTANTLQVLSKVMNQVRDSGKPFFIEARCLRLRGHAAYDTCDYVPAEQSSAWDQRDALPLLRGKLIDMGLRAGEIEKTEKALHTFIEQSVTAAMAHPPADPAGMIRDVYASRSQPLALKTTGESAEKESLTMAQALQRAHRKILREHPESLLLGQDIAGYGGPFKVTEGLYTEFGRERVINTPVCESATVGQATGLALNGHRPIVEFQFADFATDATTQIFLNAATYHFRSGASVPLVLRFPTGGGLTFGSFHSEDLEALYLHMPGLKLLYPSTPQDAYNALLAAFEDNNPVLLFEHKKLYRHGKQPVGFDPDFREVWRPRKLRDGDYATLITYGQMVYEAEAALDYLEQEYETSFDLFDLRALSPLDLDAVRASVQKTHRIIVLHEGRRTSGFGAELASRIVEEFFFDMEAPPLRIASHDIPVPFAPELESVFRPSKDSIIEAILEWME